jgi:hypothetical protein
MDAAPLLYLDFEFTEDEHGHGSFDAMAAAAPVQLRPGAGLQLRPGATGEPRVTLSVTLTGTPMFCDGLRKAFALEY